MNRESHEASPRRRPGNRAGTKRALRHGLYARSFRRGELADLDAHTAKLSDEIVMLRVMIRRLVESVDGEDLGVRESAAVLNALGAAAIRIASIARTQAQLDGDGDAEADAISHALSQMFKELDVD